MVNIAGVGANQLLPVKCCLFLILSETALAYSVALSQQGVPFILYAP